jgi:hypothetical protein
MASHTYGRGREPKLIALCKPHTRPIKRKWKDPPLKKVK